MEFSLSQQNLAGAKGRTMLAIERKNEILQKLRADQRVLVSELAAHYQVSRQTVRQALAVLTQEGLIESRQGSGSYLTGRLRDGAYNTIGILLPGDSQYLYPTFLYDLRTALHAEGFTLQVYKTEEKLSTEREMLTEILSHPPRALIVDPVQSALFNPNLDLYHALLKKSIPVVFMRHPYPQLDKCPCILEDDISGGRILTEYLITQGHTMIGSLFCADDASGADRYRGMLEVIRDHRLPLPDDRAQWFSSFDLRQLFLTHSTGFIKKAVQESLHSYATTMWLPMNLCASCMKRTIRTSQRSASSLLITAICAMQDRILFSLFRILRMRGRKD